MLVLLYYIKDYILKISCLIILKVHMFLLIFFLINYLAFLSNLYNKNIIFISKTSIVSTI